MASKWRSVDVVELNDERYILQQQVDAPATNTHEDEMENHRLVVLDDVSVVRDPEDMKEKFDL